MTSYEAFQLEKYGNILPEKDFGILPPLNEDEVRDLQETKFEDEHATAIANS